MATLSGKLTTNFEFFSDFLSRRSNCLPACYASLDRELRFARDLAQARWRKVPVGLRHGSQAMADGELVDDAIGDCILSAFRNSAEWSRRSIDEASGTPNWFGIPLAHARNLVQRACASLLGHGLAPQVPMKSARAMRAALDAENRASFASTVKTASRELSESELGDLLTDALQARQRRSGGPILLRQVTVVRGWPRSACEFLDQDQKKWNQRIASFGRDVAPHLARLLDQSRVVGLSMGHTIADAITHLKQYLETFPLSHQELVEFVATVGGDVNHPHVRRERNSSHLATELSNVVNGSWKQAYTLHGIPSFLSDVHGPDLEVVRNYIAARPCVQRVMERANHLDMLVTSCGRADRAMAFWNDELGRLEVGFAEFSRLTECEIGGILVPRSDLSARDQEQVEEMQRRWTGITLDHYRQCAA
jgi:DNA-binding transcriptional regulator LsrR (DeoR family)